MEKKTVVAQQNMDRQPCNLFPSYRGNMEKPIMSEQQAGHDHTHSMTKQTLRLAFFLTILIVAAQVVGGLREKHRAGAAG